jgi:hypothetical protein
VPAPAVIPAPIAYINAAAVKKLVVGSRVQVVGCLIFTQRRNVGVREFGSNTLHQDLHSMNGGNGTL